MNNPTTSALSSCYHCGLPCPTQTIQADDHNFCCDGCLTVYQLIQDNNLCNYYNFKDNERIQPKHRDFGQRFAYLDDTDIVNQLLQFQSTEHAIVQLDLPQMHCSSCVWLLEHLYRINNGVKESRVNFMDKTIRIDYNPASTNLRQIVELLTTLGYEPHIRLASLDATAKPAGRMRIYRIAVAGFCFGNIMMLAFPEYFHIASQGDTSLQQTFSYLSLALSLPALFFAGGEFFVSAWRGITSRYLNIDIPLVLSILLTFIRSIYEITSGTGNGYLDSMTGIIFFMLIGRYFQELTHHSVQFDRDYTSFFPISVTVVDSHDIETTIPLTKLKPGDTLVARSSELIPADSILRSNEARIDYSFVTGESQAVTVRKGEIIYAGGRLTGAVAACEVVKEVSQSYLTNLWNKEHYTEKKSTRPWVDKLAQHFTLVLLIISLGAFLYWLPYDSNRAFDALTTVLIVACPCALLLSATFTQGTMLRIFSRNGMYFKNADAIDRLAESDHFVLDKTGTLTGKEVEISYHGQELSQWQLGLIKGLTNQSNHPLSKALSHHLKSCAEFTAFTTIEEIPGKGLSGTLDDSVIRIGSHSFCTNSPSPGNNETAVHVCLNDVHLGYFEFRFALRKGADEAIKAIHQRGPIAVLSGDNNYDAERLKALLGVNAELHFRQMPSDKLVYVKALELSGARVAMIGDGLNDAGALLQSHCGITISDDVNNFTPACDVILQANSFSKLSSLLKLTQRSRQIISISFGISLLYNVIGVGLAVQGKMEPVFAAILMPLSTLTIIAFTTGASRISARFLKLS